jgi:hypothetical protein
LALVVVQGYAAHTCLGWVCGFAANPTQTFLCVVVRRQAHRVLMPPQRATLHQPCVVVVVGGDVVTNHHNHAFY